MIFNVLNKKNDQNSRNSEFYQAVYSSMFQRDASGSIESEQPVWENAV